MTTSSTQFTQDEIGFNIKNLPIPAAVAALVAGFAVVAGLIIGPGANGFISGALNYSSDSIGVVQNVVLTLSPLDGVLANDSDVDSANLTLYFVFRWLLPPRGH